MLGRLALLWPLYILRLRHPVQNYSTYPELHYASYTGFWLLVAHHVLHFVLRDHMVGNLQSDELACVIYSQQSVGGSVTVD